MCPALLGGRLRASNFPAKKAWPPLLIALIISSFASSESTMVAACVTRATGSVARKLMPLAADLASMAAVLSCIWILMPELRSHTHFW